MTKEALVETAVRLWMEKGYHNVSVNEICRECAVTKGSYYHHFESKKDLLFYHFKKTAAEKLRNTDISCGNENHLMVIKNIFHALTSAILQYNSDMIISMISKNDNYNFFTPEVYEAYLPENIYSVITAHISAGQKNSEIRTDHDAEFLLRTSFSLLTGNIMIWCYQGQPFDLLKQDEECLDLLLKKQQ